MSIQGPIQNNTSGLVFHIDTGNIKSYAGEPTTNIWSVVAGTSLNSFNSWDMPNGGTATISSNVASATLYGTWNDNRIWLVTVGSGTLASYGSVRLCVGAPTVSAYATTRRVAAKICMLGGASITNIGLHSGGGTGAYNAGDFTDIPEVNVPPDCLYKGGWKQMVSDASWTASTTHCVGIGLNGSGPYSFLLAEPMYYPGSRLMNFTPTSRSATQAILDLTGTRVLDATNGGYDSSSTPTFTGASSNYWTLPSGFLSSYTAATISVWFYWTGSETWSRIFDFGTGTTYYMFLTPKSSGGTPRFAITTSAGAGEQMLSAPSALTANAWNQFTITLNGSTGVMYLNGAAIVTNTSMTLVPSSLGTTNLNYLGKSQYADPYLNGKIAQMSIYNRALTAAEVLSNYNAARSRFGL